MKKYCEDDITRALGNIHTPDEGSKRAWEHAFEGDGRRSEGKKPKSDKFIKVSNSSEVIEITGENNVKKMRLVGDVVRCFIEFIKHVYDAPPLLSSRFCSVLK